MVNLVLTPRLASALEAYQKLSNKNISTTPTLSIQQDINAAVQQPRPESVPLEAIRHVSRTLLAHEQANHKHDGNDFSQEDSSFWIHNLLKGSSVFMEKPAPRERNPELVKTLDSIAAQQAEQEYLRMTANVDPQSEQYSNKIGNSFRRDLKDMKEVQAHLIGIINVLYTGVAVFVAVFLLSAHFTQDYGKRFLLAFLGFVLIVAGESYLYSRHATAASTSSLGPGGSKANRASLAAAKKKQKMESVVDLPSSTVKLTAENNPFNQMKTSKKSKAD